VATDAQRDGSPGEGRRGGTPIGPRYFPEVSLPQTSRGRAPGRRLRLAAALLACLSSACAAYVLAPARFRIAILDESTSRGVPAVELRTTDGRLFVSDSAGVVALSEPDLLGHPVYFEVQSFGYRHPVDGFGARATVLDVTPGGSAVLRLQRDNVAERLYRLTGSGIYRDTVLLRERARPRADRSLAVPTGMDSALATLYRGELFWIWGDTQVLKTPLGNFRATGARSRLPGDGGLDPSVGVEFRYFRDGAQLRAMVDDPHPVIWLTALRATRDAAGVERLFASYQKVEGFLNVRERGTAEFDDRKEVFRIVAPHPAGAPIAPEGHVFRQSEAGRSYLHYDLTVRSPDSAEAVRDLDSYEAFTPLRAGRSFEDGAAALERDPRGQLVWGWKRATSALSSEQWAKLLAAGAVAPREAHYALVDVETGEPVAPHHGSIAWNPYRRRWIMIRSQIGGASRLGEVYYFEADGPLGPWAYGRKIVTHVRTQGAYEGPGRPLETYTFYNPVHHPELDRDGGRSIFFEGTFTTAFAESAAPRVPGYDYNQIMYGLDLDDVRLRLPVAVYRKTDGDATAYRMGDAVPPGEADRWDLAFFAPDRPRVGTVPVHEVRSGSDVRLIAGERGVDARALFYCFPDEGSAPPPRTVPLRERRDERGRWMYDLGPAQAGVEAQTLCRVWELPVDFPRPARTPAPFAPVSLSAR
jgi:hypothetical protein